MRAGNLEDVPFTAYSSQLIVAVDSLALDVVERLDTSLDNNQNRYKLRQRILDYLEVDVQIAHQQRFLEPLRVNLPGSITQVQTSDFTSTPQVSASQIFLGGACPSTFGNPEEDRCEIITASIGLLVGEGFVSNEIQDAFQAGLDAGVTNGRLQFFLKESYPESRVKIISGEVILDRKNDASMSDESDFDVSSRMSPGAIVGIVLVVLVVLIAIYFGVVTRYCCLKNIRRNDPRRYRIDKETMDVKTLSEKSWLALSDREGGMVNDDPNDWSIPTNVAAEKPEVVFLSHDLGQFVIPLDDYLSNASVEESKDSHSKDGSIVPGKCSADGSSRTAIQMTDGSVMSGKCSANRSVMSGKYSADGSSRSGIPSKEGSVASGLSVGNSSSLGSSSTAGFMSGNRVVDLHGGRFRDHVPEVDKMEDFEANILAAIQTGDWEAVGVTAAVLASQHDSSFSGRYTSLEEQSRDCSTRGKTWQDVIDATKAAELDQLIEQGNWAGIIDAAARYESETMEIK